MDGQSGGTASAGGRGGGRARSRPRGRRPRRGRGRGGRGDAPASSGVAGAAAEERAEAAQPKDGGAVVAAVRVDEPRLHTAARTSSTTRSEMTDTPFAALPVTDVLLRAVADVMGYRLATVVQARSVPVAATGADVLVKAKTGTGKTLAFLLPALHRALQNAAPPVAVLVVSPTRELAQQIAEEARLVTTFVDGFRIQCVYGGSNIRVDVAAFRSGLPTLLVATPGRLLDHMRNKELGLAAALRGLQTLVLDEADRLLDMGFRHEVEQILAGLPAPSKRQTLLFSATMPSNLQMITNIALKRSHKIVDCVGEDVNTHERVPQDLLVIPMRDQIAALALALKECMSVPEYKVMVFFTTARLTQFYAELFTQGMGLTVLEMHSRKTQGHRNKVSEQFRNNHGLIMFSSDVTARGLDFPDVTGVVQVGRPADREQYIHRLGRTARAGKGGTGLLILSDFEADGFLKTVSDLPLVTREKPAESEMDDLRSAGLAACRELSSATKGRAYQASVGFYLSHLKSIGWNKEELVAFFNKWITEAVGEADVPALEGRTVGRMGLSGVSGIRVGRRPDSYPKPGGRHSEESSERNRPCGGSRKLGSSAGKSDPTGRANGHARGPSQGS